MSCRLCIYVGQFVINFFNLLDHTLNFILLGDSDETVSARTARARKAGQKWAYHFCDFLSFSQKIITMGKMTDDHCDYALDKYTRPNSREIWNWSNMSINRAPISEVEVIDEAEDQPQT